MDSADAKAAISLKFVDADQLRSATGRLPQAADTDHELLRAQFRDWDARRAEAILLSAEAPDPLLKLRTLLFRGRLQEAQAHLDSLPTHLDRTAVAELLLERARLESYRGCWPGARELASAALPMSPKPISCLTLFQIRGLAAYELGDFRAAAEDLDRAESMGSLFPRAASGFYCGLLKIRLTARDRGPVPARKQLGEAWRRERDGGELNLDRAHALLRTELDLLRLEARPHFPAALASLLMAERMGERLYSALGQLELMCAATPATARRLEPSIAEGAAAFERVAALREELGAACGPATSTALAMRHYREHAPGGDPARERELLDTSSRVRFLVLPAHGIRVDLREGTVAALPCTDQQARALASLAGAPVAKDLFFRALWGNQRYSPALHDPLIWTLAHRLRKATGLDVRIESASLSLPEALVLDGTA
jgi:hypothetical protein